MKKMKNIIMLPFFVFICLNIESFAGDIYLDFDSKSLNKTKLQTLDWYDPPFIPQPPSPPNPSCDDTIPGNSCGGDNGNYNNDENNGNNNWSENTIHIPTGDEDPFPLNNYWPGAICPTTGDYTSDCYYEKGKKTVVRLTNAVIDKFVRDKMIEPVLIKILFPYEMQQVKMIEALLKLEIQMINQVNDKLLNDLHKLKPFFWESKEMKEMKRKIIETDEKVLAIWKNEAMKEAMEHTNWKSNFTGFEYTFRGGFAYQQLQRTLIGKEFLGK